MDNARSPLRSVLDYVGFLVYATIVGGGLPDREAVDAAHPRNHLSLVAEHPQLTVVARTEREPELRDTAAFPENRSSNAA